MGWVEKNRGRGRRNNDRRQQVRSDWSWSESLYLIFFVSCRSTFPGSRPGWSSNLWSNCPEIWRLTGQSAGWLVSWVVSYSYLQGQGDSQQGEESQGGPRSCQEVGHLSAVEAGPGQDSRRGGGGRARLSATWTGLSFVWSDLQGWASPSHPPVIFNI